MTGGLIPTIPHVLDLSQLPILRQHYLVTGDRGLLRLGSYEGTVIITPAAFMTSLDGSEPNQT